MNVQLRSEHSQPYSLYESSCQPGLSQSLTPLNLVNERSDSYKAMLTVLHSVVYFFSFFLLESKRNSNDLKVIVSKL